MDIWVYSILPHTKYSNIKVNTHILKCIKRTLRTEPGPGPTKQCHLKCLNFCNYLWIISSRVNNLHLNQWKVVSDILTVLSVVQGNSMMRDLSRDTLNVDVCSQMMNTVHWGSAMNLNYSWFINMWHAVWKCVYPSLTFSEIYLVLAHIEGPSLLGDEGQNLKTDM